MLLLGAVCVAIPRPSGPEPAWALELLFSRVVTELDPAGSEPGAQRTSEWREPEPPAH